MQKELVELVNTLEGTTLAMEELNSAIPNVKKLYNDCNIMMTNTVKIKEEIVLLQIENKKLIGDAKKNADIFSLDVTDKTNDAIKKIEALEKTIKKIERESKEQLDAVLKVGTLNKRMEGIMQSVADMEKRMLRIEQEISTIKQHEKNFDNFLNTKSSLNSLNNSAAMKVHIPSGCRSFLLSDPDDVKGMKPYQVIFEKSGALIQEKYWTKLTEKIIIFVLDNYAKDKGKKLKDSQAHDGWEHYYFYEGNQNSESYAYIEKYNLSVYKAGSNNSIEIYQELCKEYRIPLDSVRVIYR